MSETTAALSAHGPGGVSEATIHGNVNRKFGFWLFLSSELLIFAGLIFSFVVTRQHQILALKDWHEFNAFSLSLVSVNTFVLLFSSVCVVAGIDAIRRQDRRNLIKWLSITMVMGIVFLLGQANEYSTLFSEGISMAHPFGGAFFTLTGLHGLHVLMGVFWCAAVILQSRKGIYSASNYTSVEIFGLYWHFVDLVWVLIFTIIYLI